MSRVQVLGKFKFTEVGSWRGDSLVAFDFRPPAPGLVEPSGVRSRMVDCLVTRVLLILLMQGVGWEWISHVSSLAANVQHGFRQPDRVDWVVKVYVKNELRWTLVVSLIMWGRLGFGLSGWAVSSCTCSESGTRKSRFIDSVNLNWYSAEKWIHACNVG